MRGIVYRCDDPLLAPFGAVSTIADLGIVPGVAGRSRLDGVVDCGILLSDLALVERFP